MVRKTIIIPLTTQFLLKKFQDNCAIGVCADSLEQPEGTASPLREAGRKDLSREVLLLWVGVGVDTPATQCEEDLTT